jgi:hypothetical protein
MIGNKTIDEIKRGLGELLDIHKGEVDAAYIKAEEGISITFGVKITPIAPGVHMVKTGISFVTARVRDEIGCKVNEDQGPLFKAVEKLRPKKGDGIDSITVSDGAGRSATLKARES